MKSVISLFGVCLLISACGGSGSPDSPEELSSEADVKMVRLNQVADDLRLSHGIELPAEDVVLHAEVESFNDFMNQASYPLDRLLVIQELLQEYVRLGQDLEFISNRLSESGYNHVNYYGRWANRVERADIYLTVIRTELAGYGAGWSSQARSGG